MNTLFWIFLIFKINLINPVDTNKLINGDVAAPNDFRIAPGDKWDKGDTLTYQVIEYTNKLPKAEVLINSANIKIIYPQKSLILFYRSLKHNFRSTKS